MFDKLETIKQKYEKLKEDLYSPEISSNVQKTIQLSKEINELEEIYNLYIQWKKYNNEIIEAKNIIETEKDEDVLEMAKEQSNLWLEKKEELEKKLEIALIPKDINDDKNIYMEIRPAAWGDESALFAEEMMRMYINYAEIKWWKSSIEEIQEKEWWWIKFVMLKIVWEHVFSQLKYESWVHRVQRIPTTESQWRVHTSTITVAVLPEIDEIIEYDLDMNDIEMQFLAASSAGWQHANRNKTWVRLQHIPSWTIVVISDSKSQVKNKEKAFNILKARLLQVEQEKQAEEQRDERLYQLWSWARSEKIRTYNFPQDRITDHRIKKSYSNLPWILNWDIWWIINDLILEDQARLIKESINK